MRMFSSLPSHSSACQPWLMIRLAALHSRPLPAHISTTYLLVVPITLNR